MFPRAGGGYCAPDDAVDRVVAAKSVPDKRAGTSGSPASGISINVDAAGGAGQAAADTAC